ncbi:dihydrofolate reductase family protein [Zhihengliuella sp.]|uniref:dihydrofolate reductase family protein n=1 Tax=Zhihengliuella sp. TaxID=1954483 RepID=UPI0028128027|nr:dihydrofolate reductase family protein [Zhihengliuella sp.]
MGQLIATAFVSLDGVMEAPGGEDGYRNAGWTFDGIDFVEEAYELKAAEQAQAGSLMLGRRSYEAFAPVWPSMEDEFPRYNAMPKYVVSTTLDPGQLVSDWGRIEILRSADDVAAVKQSSIDPIIIHGSGELVRSLTDAGLVDRFHLLVFPKLLGAGKRYFSEADKAAQNLRLVESTAYSNGVQKLILDLVH